MASAITGLHDPGQQAELLSFMVAQTDQLLQRPADGRSNRWGRDRLRQFRRRWGAADAAGDADATRRVLVIDEALPRAGHDAGSNAILSHMRALQSLGYAVSLVAASGLEAPRDQVAALETLGIEVWAAPFYASVEDVLRRQSDCFDGVYLHRAAIASRYMALARAHQPRARIVYAVADLHHLRLERQAVVEGRPELLAASRVGMEERMHAWMADAVITHSATEAALLRHAVPEASVHQVAWDVPVRRVAASWSRRHGVAFIGAYDHAPNQDAAAWLAEVVMPMVWRSEPGLICFLAGSNMPLRSATWPGLASRQSARLPTLAPCSAGSASRWRPCDLARA